ncbi:dTDP-4-dehydrorhamnose reductase [Dyadobacter tibetensis]|uniref:dTDP-4-dehydrorhamnose reductase n=1 Tax=Dyadobacter tibetensis TaxID=1211851 RepID=UPI00046E6369|nr:dTDP-4-dehydrorhamnose reductase [Dyadobacter tibetensis]
MKSLVLGASGQLGSCLKKVASERSIDSMLFPTEEEGNILDPALLDLLLEREKPNFVINCAAYTAVDKAEDEQDICRKINKDGAANIAHACKKHGAAMIQISTDFVFKGDVQHALTETDIAAPENIYGLTKLEGEQAIVGILDEHYILRTSWLYSEYGNNFVKTMIRLSRDHKDVNVIIDQIGSPTYAIDLADTIVDIMESPTPHYGLYHYSNEGAVSWFDFARAIFDLDFSESKVSPIRSSEYKTKATRPAFSVMDKSKIKQTFNLEIPYWRDSLVVCVGRL